MRTGLHLEFSRNTKEQELQFLQRQSISCLPSGSVPLIILEAVFPKMGQKHLYVSWRSLFAEQNLSFHSTSFYGLGVCVGNLPCSSVLYPLCEYQSWRTSVVQRQLDCWCHRTLPIGCASCHNNNRQQTENMVAFALEEHYYRG